MKEEVFVEILRCVKPPIGTLLADGNTYRVEHDDFICINTIHHKELESFEKFLVLTNNNSVVGGVLFYGNVDIQAKVFPEYKGMHFMSSIHKNGILTSECYEKQKVTIDTHHIESFDDFCMKHYLLSCAGLKISNLDKIYKYLCIFQRNDDFNEMQKFDEKTFVEKFS